MARSASPQLTKDPHATSRRGASSLLGTLARPSLREALAAILLLSAVAAAGHQAISRGTDALLRWDATTGGLEWASFLGVNQHAFAAAVGPDARLADRREAGGFFDDVFRDGRIFHVEAFAPDGETSLAYGLYEPGRLDGAPTAAPAGPAIFLSAHRFLSAPPYRTSAEAAAALTAGGSLILLHEGDGVALPTRYAEVVAPAGAAGPVAALRVLVDLSDRAELYRALGVAVAVASALAAVALLMGPGALYLRSRRSQMRADDDARFFATHDRLTGALNRAGLVAVLDRELARPSGAAAMIAIDVKGFRTINDAHGHAAADRVLIDLAAALATRVGDRGLVARIGADVFAAVWLGEEAAADGGDLDAFAAAADEAASEVKVAGDDAFSMKIATGGAVAPDHGEDGETLLANAALALRWSKQAAHGGCVSFSPALAEGARDRARLAGYLREALEERRFWMAFQPKFDPGSRRLTGFEALMRLSDRDGAPISPALFIPVAEETGLIAEIGGLALETATEIAARWSLPLKIAVNLSPEQLMDPDIEGRLDRALAASGLEPSRLEIEVTESTLIENAKAAAAILDRLKARGPTIALDDFGAGYSGLGHLWRYSFDRLKIDRSFMGGLETRPQETRYVLDLVAALGRTLRVGVTAEGVETDAQLDAVRAAGCDEVQGFLFGRPTPAEDLQPFFDAEIAARDEEAADARFIEAAELEAARA